jgi:acetyltransferase-like isoleucine patch superfamily enzyme
LDIDSVSKIVLGQGVVVRRYVYLSALDHGTLTLEDGVYINEFNNIRAAGGDITIGSRTIIAQFVSIIATNHKIPPREQRVRDAGIEQEGSGVKIGRDVWIAANVVILPGVEVGDGAVIGAGAVVSKSIPAYAIAVGNPARVIRYR